MTTETGALDHALALEGSGPITLPRDFSSLSVEEQLFVVTDLERTARGEAPVLGLSSVVDTNAEAGAIAGDDPHLDPASWPWATWWGANWAGNSVNALDADYGWMYEDGWEGPSTTSNIDCTGPDAPGCWGHRDIILSSPGRSLVMGAGFASDIGRWTTSFTELFVAVPEPGEAPPLYYTWADAVAAGAKP